MSQYCGREHYLAQLGLKDGNLKKLCYAHPSEQVGLVQHSWSGGTKFWGLFHGNHHGFEEGTSLSPSPSANFVGIEGRLYLDGFILVRFSVLDWYCSLHFVTNLDR